MEHLRNAVRRAGHQQIVDDRPAVPMFSSSFALYSVCRKDLPPTHEWQIVKLKLQFHTFDFPNQSTFVLLQETHRIHHFVAESSECVDFLFRELKRSVTSQIE